MLFLLKSFCRTKRFNRFYIKDNMSTDSEDIYLQAAKFLVPSLNINKHKGQNGRIGIIGGSVEYTGAPFFAGMSALRTGADLAYIFCCREAATAIKSYSPELIVQPYLDLECAFELIEPWLDRLHVILIGPGLGRDLHILNGPVTSIINYCQIKSKPLIIDADGLYLVSENPRLLSNCSKVILTPNVMEFTRLVKKFLNKTIDPNSDVKDEQVKELANKIGPNAIVLLKGKSDIISTSTVSIHCSVSGSGRRCGGQGDLLSGSLSILTWWAQQNNTSLSKFLEANNMTTLNADILACYAASRLIRETNASTFIDNHRGMLASDMLNCLANNFHRTLEVD